MRISDWSSDVCSSDLSDRPPRSLGSFAAANTDIAWHTPTHAHIPMHTPHMHTYPTNGDIAWHTPTYAHIPALHMQMNSKLSKCPICTLCTMDTPTPWPSYGTIPSRDHLY